MFTIRADFGDTFEIKTTPDEARAFFSDIKNFVELMPNVESIHTNAQGITQWTIKADIPLIGAMRQSFAVELTENSPERIEWTPAASETQNYLRYGADFLETENGVTQVKIEQIVELRRKSARQLHLLAGLAGEAPISRGMQAEVAGMIKNFMQRAKEKLEKSSGAA